MLEEEQKEWLEIFEREFLDRLHNPATLADSVASGALLRINDVVFSPDTGEDISTILNMLDKKGSVYILARDGATGPDGKVYTIDSGVLVGAEKMGFKPDELRKMKPSEVLTMAAITFASTRDLEREKIAPTYNDIMAVYNEITAGSDEDINPIDPNSDNSKNMAKYGSTVRALIDPKDEDKALYAIQAERRAFTNTLYKAVKGMIRHDHQELANKAMDAKFKQPVIQSPTEDEAEKYDAARATLDKVINSSTNVNDSMKESIQAIIEQVESLKTRKTVPIEDLTKTLTITQKAIDKPEAAIQLLHLAKHMEKVDRTTAVLLNGLQKEMAELRKSPSMEAARQRIDEVNAQTPVSDQSAESDPNPTTFKPVM